MILKKYLCLLGLLSVFEATAIRIAQKTNEIDLVPGCSPISVAAAALFMTLQASDEKKIPSRDSRYECHIAWKITPVTWIIA